MAIATWFGLLEEDRIVAAGFGICEDLTVGTGPECLSFE